MLKKVIDRLSNKDYLVLFMICCLGFWQLTLFQNIMKWDILDINLPWRYFVSECLQNGILPLWNPYINCGFPQSADPMTWYPISWLIGFIVGNNLITLQYEYLFHIFIGSLGIFQLGSLFNFDRQTKLILSISFMFSGLFVSNAQHLGWIVSAAWFPFILYHYIVFCKSLKLQNGVLFILFFFFQLTGGYAGFFIITGYILVGLFLFFLIRYWKDQRLKKYIALNAFHALLFILLSSVVLISSLKVSTLLTRYDQLGIEYVTEGALPLKALISFVFPFAATTNAEFWGTDLTLLNCYIGIIPLLFLVFGAITNRNVYSRLFLIIGIGFLTLALAHVFPFRKWLFYLPFMNIFRFPTIFRFFAMVSFILVAGTGINQFFKNEHDQKRLKVIVLAFSAIVLVAIVYNVFFIQKWVFKSLLLFDFKVFLDAASIHDRIFLQAIIALAILVSFYFILGRYKGKTRKIWFIVLVAGDLIIATQLNMYHTIVDFASPKSTQRAINNLPQGFPLPDMNEKVIDRSDQTAPSIPFLWRNLNIFHKRTTFSGYSPYYFSSMLKAEKEGVMHVVIKNPLFYLADCISSKHIIDSLSIDTLSAHKIAIKRFIPTEVKLKVYTNKKQLLTFIQNYYPGWKVYVNGTEKEIIRSNYTFMSVWIEHGENNIKFEYKPQKVMFAFYLSSIIFIGIIVYLSVSTILGYYRKKKTREDIPG